MDALLDKLIKYLTDILDHLNKPLALAAFVLVLILVALWLLKKQTAPKLWNRLLVAAFGLWGVMAVGALILAYTEQRAAPAPGSAANVPPSPVPAPGAPGHAGSGVGPGAARLPSHG